MTKLKKLTAILMSAVLLICVFSIQVSAESITNTASSIKSGETYSTRVYDYGDTQDYKITTTKSGKLVLSVTTYTKCVYVYIYDSNGNIISLSDDTTSTGYINKFSSGCSGLDWNENLEKYSGKLTYKISKGTYYIRFERVDRSSGSGKISFTATFPSSSSSEKLTGISVPMSVGGTLQLSALTSSGTSSSATWSSSNTAVATVSSTGKVTAKKKGTVTITAKSGSTKVSIVIKVS